MDVLGQRYGIDFVGVDERGRTSPVRDWRTVLGSEPPERFVAFGRPLLAPVDGVVVAAHDGEADHEARRSQLALVPYAVGQAGRLRQGLAAVAGNYMVIRDDVSGMFVALAHLRDGSQRVRVCDQVRSGAAVAQCGNSGNSTQPHVHLQVMDGADLALARGVPVTFARYRERARGGREGPRDVAVGVPAEGAVVEPSSAAAS